MVINHSDFYRLVSEFEQEYGDEIIKTIKDKDHPFFVDVGCAQGLYTILAAKAGAQVFAIDPDPISQRSLAGNIEINGDVRENIVTREIALGNTHGKMILYADLTGTYAPSLSPIGKGLANPIEVEIHPFDSLVGENSPIPDVVKIDVEGAEGLVIEGMKRILTSENKPTDLFVELHQAYLPKFGSSVSEVDNKIRSFGYELVSHRERRNEELCHYNAPHLSKNTTLTT